MNDPKDLTLSTAAADDTASRNGPGTLSERVRSLQLPGRDGQRGPRRTWLPWLLSLVLLGTTLFFAIKAFRNPRSEEIEATARTNVPGVNMSVAGSGEVVLESKGYIIPAHQVQVSPKVAGMIKELNKKFKEGERFRENEELAWLEDVDYKADRDRAQATLDLAKKRLRELQESTPLERKQAEARLAHARSVMEYRDREVNRLLASGASASSNRERDEALSLAVQGRKAFDEARLAVDLLSETGPRQRRILALQAEVEQAQADLDKADWRWKNCIIRAPISGTILSKKAEKGNIVNPVAFNVSASLCDMANLRQLEVDLNIQERDIAQVVQGQECRVVPEAFQRNEAFRQRHPEGYRGTVSRLMPIADRSKGAIPVRVEIHPDQIPPEEEGMFLKPEMSVIVSFFQKKI